MRALAGAIAAAALLAGCGEEERPAPAPQAVRLLLTAPTDRAVVDGDSVQIRGSVTPAGSSVMVRGEAAEVVGGRFVAEVELDPGANLIDVAAAATGRRPALAALRVVRQMPVEIPDLEGEEPDAAVARLQTLGLEPQLREGGGLFEDLLPGTVGVCGTDPAAGEEVRPGTVVEVEVAKAC